MRVIESKTAPKVRLQGGMHMATPAAEGGGMEPIPDHIVEVPDDNLRAEARDTRMGWTAYVPPGTLNKGKQLANQASVQRSATARTWKGSARSRRSRAGRRATRCASCST